MLKSLAPLATAAVLFGVLIVSSGQHRRQLTAVAARRDSVIAQLREDQRVGDALLSAGDSLPPVRLRAISGEVTDLQALARGKVRYLYFYRSDCAPCQLMAGLWPGASPAKRDSIAFITFHPDHDVPPERRPGHYGWIHDSTTSKRYVRRVPTLLVVKPDGRVLAAAQESVIRVSKVLDMFAVLPRSEVDRAIAAAQRGAAQAADSLLDAPAGLDPAKPALP